jgi:RHS repeat-associated protein
VLYLYDSWRRIEERDWDATVWELRRHYPYGGQYTEVDRVTYDPYGEATFEAGGSTGNPYLFQGRRLDSETGLYYFRNRNYSPELGRFMQRDPAGYGDGMNLSLFAGDSPTTFSDPFGRRRPKFATYCY